MSNKLPPLRLTARFNRPVPINLTASALSPTDESWSSSGAAFSASDRRWKQWQCRGGHCIGPGKTCSSWPEAGHRGFPTMRYLKAEPSARSLAAGTAY